MFKGIGCHHFDDLYHRGGEFVAIPSSVTSASRILIISQLMHAAEANRTLPVDN
jgi:hypothetical protein